MTSSDFMSSYTEYMAKLTEASLEFSKKYSTKDMMKHLYGKSTNFEMVKAFNTTANANRIREKPTPAIFDDKPAIIESALKLIREEVTELEDAVKAKDLTETRDALADILYVVYGMAFRLGIDADADFKLVHDSNMSKFCESEEMASATVAQYKTKFELGESPYSSPAYKYEPETKLWIVYEETTGKILKSAIYKPVDLSN